MEGRFGKKVEIPLDDSILVVEDDKVTFSVHKVDQLKIDKLCTAEETFKNAMEDVKTHLELGNPSKTKVKSKKPSSTTTSTTKKVSPGFKGFGTIQDSSIRRENAKAKEWIPSGTSLFHSLTYAFTNHQNFCLSPSDLIVMIGQGLANHINMNAEKLRHHFVEHDGQKTIEVINPELKLDGKSDWSKCFGDFCEKIKTMVKKDVYSVVIDDVSTSSPITRIVSELNLMDALKNYFHYETGEGCGFPKIVLKGTVDDWKKFQEKVKILKDMNGSDVLELDWWLKVLVPVVDKICEAGIDRKIDYKFWANIYVTYWDYFNMMNGWFNVFIPYTYSHETGYKKNRVLQKMNDDFTFEHGIDDESVPEGVAKVPFVHKDSVKGEHKMHFYAGFLGSRYDAKNNWIEPAYFWSVYQDPTK